MHSRHHRLLTASRPLRSEHQGGGICRRDHDGDRARTAQRALHCSADSGTRCCEQLPQGYGRYGRCLSEPPPSRQRQAEAEDDDQDPQFLRGRPGDFGAGFG